MGLTRQPAVSGSFYPGIRDELTNVVQHYLDEASPQAAASAPKAIIAPHAGYIYSGAVAASAYVSLAKARSTVTRVVLLGPSHRVAVRGLATTSAEFFLTPLGSVPIDREAVALALRFPQVTVVDAAHAQEHSLEVQLPFIQRLFPGSEVLPILAGTIPGRSVERLSASLKSVFENDWESVLTVATTNMGSYRDTQSADPDSEALQSFLGLIKGADVKGITEAKLNRETSACGACCVATLLSLVGKDCRAEVLKESSSKGAGPSRDAVVHYAAISFHKETTG